MDDTTRGTHAAGLIPCTGSIAQVFGDARAEDSANEIEIVRSQVLTVLIIAVEQSAKRGGSIAALGEHCGHTTRCSVMTS